jgi:hypothetical protein
MFEVARAQVSLTHRCAHKGSDKEGIAAISIAEKRCHLASQSDIASADPHCWPHTQPNSQVAISQLDVSVSTSNKIESNCVGRLHVPVVRYDFRK